MPKTRNLTRIEKEQTDFAVTLRAYLNSNPITGEAKSQRDLAAFLEVRPQTVSQYCNGITLPNIETIIKIAEFFNISVEHLITGQRPEDKPITAAIGLSEQTIENLKLVNEGYFEDTPEMITIIDNMLSEKDFYKAIESAAHWIGVKSDNMPPDQQEFCEWKAAQFMQTFLMEFFSRKFSNADRSESNGNMETV